MKRRTKTIAKSSVASVDGREQKVDKTVAKENGQEENVAQNTSPKAHLSALTLLSLVDEHSRTNV